MDFEERERRRRRQFIKVLIAEAGMACSIVAIVVVATLVAMGFFVTKDGSIEQSGLVQLHSMPTGATVELDGTTLFSRTNLSRTLSAGEHEIKISRAGYDSWSKTVKMYSGILIRLYYPRLFLENRSAEQVQKLGEQLALYSSSDDSNNILYATSGSAIWQLINLRNDDLRVTELNLAEILPSTENGVFAGKVEVASWSKNSEYVLIKASVAERTEWILLNLRDLNNSLNLTKTFALNFERVEMIDGSAGQLFALENGNLRKINTGDRTISQVLLNNLESFDSEGANLIYVQNATKDNQKIKVIGTYRNGERGGMTITTVSNDAKVKVALSKYYDEDYMIWTVNDLLTVYYGSVPAYREEAKVAEFTEQNVLLRDMKLSNAPDGLNLSTGGEYVVAHKDKKFMVIDLEMGDSFEYDAVAASVQWLDASILMAVNGNKLQVWDFDGTNQRTLVQSVDKVTEGAERNAVTTEITATLVNYPATITSNNKWLYYVVRSNGNLVLMREKIRD